MSEIVFEVREDEVDGGYMAHTCLDARIPGFEALMGPGRSPLERTGQSSSVNKFAARNTGL
jgi:hypothetical protein